MISTLIIPRLNLFKEAELYAENSYVNIKDGKLNPLFTIDKGQLSDLYYFATFEEEEGLDNPDYNKLMQMVEEKKKNRIILPN